jgi:hypothetical protein
MKIPPLIPKIVTLGFTTLILSCSVAKPGRSEDTPIFLWEVESPQNSVYLLGSIHTLRETDYPLPQTMLDAFDDAERLVFEINLAEAETVATQQTILQAALPDSPEESLTEALTPDAYQTAERAIADLGFPIAAFNSFEPWFFSITLTSLRLVQLGFEPSYGVDFFLFNEAQTAAKPIAALETIEAQMSIFDDLPLSIQSELVEQTVLELDLLESSFNTLIDAWKSGDVATFEQLSLESFTDYPEVYDVLLTQRNQNWLPTVEALVNQPDDYLIVVGAAHLVGDDSLVRLLSDQGYTVRQLATHTSIQP